MPPLALALVVPLALPVSGTLSQVQPDSELEAAASGTGVPLAASLSRSLSESLTPQHTDSESGLKATVTLIN